MSVSGFLGLRGVLPDPAGIRWVTHPCSRLGRWLSALPNGAHVGPREEECREDQPAETEQCDAAHHGGASTQQRCAGGEGECRRDGEPAGPSERAHSSEAEEGGAEGENEAEREPSEAVAQETRDRDSERQDERQAETQQRAEPQQIEAVGLVSDEERRVAAQ